MILLTSKTLNLIPKGKIIKEFLNKVIIGKTLVFKEEIEEGDIIVEDLQLVPLPHDLPDFEHQILYAIAHSKNIAK